MAFNSLGLKEWIVKQISTVGYRIPTAVQVNCIPPILQGMIRLLEHRVVSTVFVTSCCLVCCIAHVVIVKEKTVSAVPRLAVERLQPLPYRFFRNLQKIPMDCSPSY